MQREKTTWGHILAAVLICLIIGLLAQAGQAQNLQIPPPDTTIYTLLEFDTIRLTYEFPDYSSQIIGSSRGSWKTKPVARDIEIFHAIPILPHYRRAIMQYLMEPGETITIKKVKE